MSRSGSAGGAAAAAATADRRHRFDDLRVSTSRDRSFRSVHPPVLSFDRSAIYAGERANWRLPFKQLDAVGRNAVERYDRGRNGIAGRNGVGRARGGGQGGGPSEILELTLEGRKVTLKCTARDGGRALEEFVKDLKDCHRRAKLKKGEKDPYAFEEEEDLQRRRASVGRADATKKSRGGRQRRVITPAAALYLSPARKRATAGAFRSPARRRRSDGSRGAPDAEADAGSGGGGKGGDDQYRRYDPSFAGGRSSTPRARGRGSLAGDDVEGGDGAASVVGNVVTAPPAARKLDLPPKSPRNATPTKLRPTEGRAVERKARSILSQLNGISGGDIELKARDDADAGFDEDELDGLEESRGRRERARGEASQTKSEEEENNKDASAREGARGAPKRRRLKKVGADNRAEAEAGDDSELEFDEGEEEGASEGRPSSCRKKLRLSDEDDDEEDEKDEMPTTPAREEAFPTGKASGKAPETPASKPPEISELPSAPDSALAAAEKAPATPVSKPSPPPSEAADVSSKAEDTPNQSTADAALAPSPAKKAPPKKGTLASFFQPVGSGKKALSKRSGEKDNVERSAKPSAKRSSPETYGALLSTPKKARHENVPRLTSSGKAPATPPRRTDTSKPTPVPRQTQRKSRYFATKSDNLGEGKALDYSSGGDAENVKAPEYSSGDEEGANEFRDNYDYYDEDKAANTLQRSQGIKQRRGYYGRPRLGAPRLGVGRARIEARNPTDAQSKSLQGFRRSPQGRLDFARAAAGPSTPSAADRALAPRTPGSVTPLARRNGFSSVLRREGSGGDDAPPPLVASLREDEPAARRVPGIQNLGNTCFLSSSLQALFSLPSFLRDLSRSHEDLRSQHPGREMPLARSLLEVACATGALDPEEAASINPAAGATKPTASTSAGAAPAGDPAALKRAMDGLTNKFAGYEQRDAHEFLSDLVDFLHDELAGTTSSPASEGGGGAPTAVVAGEGAAPIDVDENRDPNEMADEEGSAEGGKGDVVKGDASNFAARDGRGVLPTDEYFRLDVRVCLKCDACGYSRSKDEMYRHLSVDVEEGDAEPDKSTVERSLRQFFQPERREIKCEKCDEGTSATQTMEITSCPKALLLHFKRFIVTQETKGSAGKASDEKENKAAAVPRMEMVLRKNKARITLDESLSIDPFVGGKDKGVPPDNKYRLRGVVHHVGGTASSGHYTTCARRTLPSPERKGGEGKKPEGECDAPGDEEQWVFFDDRVGVEKDAGYVTGNERNQRNCYMALFELE